MKKEWGLVTATDSFESVLKILQEGLRSSAETGNSNYGVSEYVHFTGIPKGMYTSSFEGRFVFVLSHEYLLSNRQQFGVSSSAKVYFGFDKFVEELGLRTISFPRESMNEVLSTRPVPVEGIERLIVFNPYECKLYQQELNDILSQPMEHLQVYSRNGSYQDEPIRHR